ncbi:MAG: HAMP domain-containing histidine kinase [Clostridia bacterium]|nr:HAMP domain-containing histidine kinase [Clostridia bacterium]
MNRIRTNLAIKTLAVILSTVLMIVMLFSVIATALLGALGAYSDPVGFKEQVLSEILLAESTQIEWYFHEQNKDVLLSGEPLPVPDFLSAEQTNLRFTVTDESGNKILANESAPSAKSMEYTFTVIIDHVTHTESKTVYTDEDANEFYASIDGGKDKIISTQWAAKSDEDGQVVNVLTITWEEYTELVYTLSYAWEDPLPVMDFTYYAFHYLDDFVALRWAFPFMAIGSVVLLSLLLIYLCWAAGYRKNADEPVPNLIDRIPLDLYIAMLVGVGALLLIGWMLAFEEIVDVGTPDLAILFAVLGLICLLALSAMLLSLLLTIASRIKRHTLLRNTVLWRIGSLIRKVIRKVWHGVRFYLENLPLYWKTGAAIVILLLLELIVLCSGSVEVIALCLVIGNAILIPVAIYCVIQYKQLSTAAKRIAEGDTAYQIDTSNMVAELKSHAEALNGIGAGMQKAVDARMKSERFKTELITNVSHDIKTPLTSIINYVDLLKKEEIGIETAKEYVEVLDRQSARLKKLTEDLVEASKASTGNLTVNAETLELNLLLSQAVAEFRDKLDAKALTVVTTFADDGNCKVTADGRLLWRVCENLLSNVCKYAQEQTRVYISTEVIGERVRLTVKNTSKYALNISSEELMERFTRGDASRHTEGSGLGLSIARSLVELQKGNFGIVIDGDLFKVSVTLPKS